MSTVAGLLLALGASVLYNGGLLLQAHAARREPTTAAVEPGLLARLALRRRWLAGTVVTVSGWPLQALALTRAPLTLVQPALGAGLVIPLLFGTRLLGEQSRSRDFANVVLLAAGVSLLVFEAPPLKTATPPMIEVASVFGALAVVVIAALALAPVSVPHRGGLVVAGAGVAFALSSLSTKLLADSITHHLWLRGAIWGVFTAVVGGAGLLAEMHALQVRTIGSVASLVFGLETIIPVALSPILFGETGRGSAAMLAARATALGLAIVGAIGLSRTPAVTLALSEAVAPDARS